MTVISDTVDSSSYQEVIDDLRRRGLDALANNLANASSQDGNKDGSSGEKRQEQQQKEPAQQQQQQQQQQEQETKVGSSQNGEPNISSAENEVGEEEQQFLQDGKEPTVAAAAAGQDSMMVGAAMKVDIGSNSKVPSAPSSDSVAEGGPNQHEDDSLVDRSSSHSTLVIGLPIVEAGSQDDTPAATAQRNGIALESVPGAFRMEPLPQPPESDVTEQQPMAADDRGGDHDDHDADNGVTLEAIRVDDIETVRAEPMSSDQKQTQDDIRHKHLICMGVAALIGTITIIVLSLVLGLRGSNSEDRPLGDQDESTQSPTYSPLERFDLLQEFFVKTFAPMYNDDDNNNTSLGWDILEELLSDVQTPQYRALSWLALEDGEVETSIRLDFLRSDSAAGGGNLTDDVTSKNRRRILQRYALAVLYFATGGPTNWVDKYEFLAPGHECDWSGALGCGSVQRGGEVDGLNVSLIDGDAINYMDLQANGLVGTVVPELSALSHLVTLNLLGNALEGPLPQALAALSELKEVQIAQNNLNGTLVEAFFERWRHLEIFYIGDNSFSGTLSSQIANMVNLTYFGAERLHFTGTVPKELYQHLTKMEKLEMSNMKYGFVNDTIATEIGLWTNLQSFIMHGAELKGSLPSEIAFATKLSRLQLNSNHMSGQIPVELGSLTAMTRLQLSMNGLTGTLPSSFTNLLQLERLELQNTLLTGDVRFMCDAINAGNMPALDTIQFDMGEVSGCNCCDCCEY